MGCLLQEALLDLHLLLGDLNISITLSKTNKMKDHLKEMDSLKSRKWTRLDCLLWEQKPVSWGPLRSRPKTGFSVQGFHQRK